MPPLVHHSTFAGSSCTPSSCNLRYAPCNNPLRSSSRTSSHVCCLGTSSSGSADSSEPSSSTRVAQLLRRRNAVAQHQCGDGCGCSSSTGFSVRQQDQLLLSPTAALIISAACAGPLLLAAAAVAADAIDASTAAASAEAVAGAAATAKYVPSPLEVPSWQIWAGFVAGVVPFIIGSWEFGKRIVIQLRCEVCDGRGLVRSAGPGRDKYLRKCTQCGGFFPWVSWKMFLSSTAAPGNGGPLLQPKGQTSVFYTVPPPRVPGQAREPGAAGAEAEADGGPGSAAGGAPVAASEAAGVEVPAAAGSSSPRAGPGEQA